MLTVGMRSLKKHGPYDSACTHCIIGSCKGNYELLGDFRNTSGYVFNFYPLVVLRSYASSNKD
jgi:hypothetical protein